jgi:hypothetical protein
MLSRTISSLALLTKLSPIGEGRLGFVTGWHCCSSVLNCHATSLTVVGVGTFASDISGNNIIEGVVQVLGGYVLSLEGVFEKGHCISLQGELLLLEGPDDLFSDD